MCKTRVSVEVIATRIQASASQQGALQRASPWQRTVLGTRVLKKTWQCGRDGPPDPPKTRVDFSRSTQLTRHFLVIDCQRNTDPAPTARRFSRWVRDALRRRRCVTVSAAFNGPFVACATRHACSVKLANTCTFVQKKRHPSPNFLAFNMPLHACARTHIKANDVANGRPAIKKQRMFFHVLFVYSHCKGKYFNKNRRHTSAKILIVLLIVNFENER